MLSAFAISGLFVFWESGRVKPHKSYLICPQLGLLGGTVVFNTQCQYQLLTATTCYIWPPITQVYSCIFTICEDLDTRLVIRPGASLLSSSVCWCLLVAWQGWSVLLTLHDLGSSSYSPTRPPAGGRREGDFNF